MRHLLLGIIMALAGAHVANAQCMDNPAYASTCQLLFFNTTTNITNVPACQNPIFASLVPQCPFSCNLCAQLGYNCNNTVSQNTCQALTSQCNSTAPLYQFMQLYCPATCALCPITGGGVCSDQAGVNCSVIASLCNNPATFTTLTTVCPSTCMRCPTGAAVTTTTAVTTTIATTTTVSSCKDLASNCAAALVSSPGLCTNAVYLTLMQAQCAKTCAFCTTG